MLFSISALLFSRVVVSSLIATLVALSPAGAGEHDGLEGKTIRAIIGSSAGGTTDTTSRAFYDRLEKTLPETTIRVQNIDGSGGAKALKEMQGAEGSVITLASFGYGPIYRQLLSPDISAFDLTQVHWIGALTRVQRVLAMRPGLGGTTLAALRSLGRQPVSATADALSSSTIDTLLLNAMLELQMRVIPGTSDAQQAAMLLSGDIDLVLGDRFEFDPQFKSGQLIPVLRLSTTTEAETLAGVPAIADLVSTKVPQELVFLLETLGKSGHLIAAAPSTDPAIVEALRESFEKVAHDPTFADEMAKRGIAIASTPGDELTDRLEEVLGASSATLQAALQSYLACGKRMSDEGATSCD